MTESGRKNTTSMTSRSPDNRALRSRPRRGGLLAFAALMIVGSAIAVAVLVSRAGDTQEVLVARAGIAEGHTITRSDLASARVSGIDGAYPVGNPSALVGSTAVVDIVAGQVFTPKMMSRSPVPGPGQSLVGLNLDPSRAPSAGLDPGDHVAVVAVATGEGGAVREELDAPAVLAAEARVLDVAGSATDGGGVLVTLVVADADATRVAAYSVAGRVAIIEVAAPVESGA